MNARKSTHYNVTSAFLIGALLAALSFNAAAESTLSLSIDARAPVGVTVLPSVKVTASISDPSSDVRWSIDPKRPLRVTLMPTVTVTANIADVAITTLPTVSVIAELETPPMENSFALAPSADAPMLGVSN